MYGHECYKWDKKWLKLSSKLNETPVILEIWPFLESNKETRDLQTAPKHSLTFDRDDPLM